MARLFVVTFLFLGWAWWELSGGADFVPGDNGVTLLARPHPVQTDRLIAQREPDGIVARDDTVVALTDTTGPVQTFPNSALRQAESIVPASLVQDAQAPMPAPRVDPVKAALVAALATDPAPEAEPGPAIYTITGSRVNMRNGPGTRYSVVTQLARGDEVVVIRQDDTGWVKLRSPDTARVGWMSAQFVAPAE